MNNTLPRLTFRYFDTQNNPTDVGGRIVIVTATVNNTIGAPAYRDTLVLTRAQTGVYQSPQRRYTGSALYTITPLGIATANITGERTFTVTPRPAAGVLFTGVTPLLTTGGAQARFRATLHDTYNNLTDEVRLDSLTIVQPTLVAFSLSTDATLDDSTKSANAGFFTLQRTSLGVFTADAASISGQPFLQAGAYTLAMQGVASTTGTAAFTVRPNVDFRVVFEGVPDTLVAGDSLRNVVVRYFDRNNNPTDNGLGRVVYSRAGGSSTATVQASRLETGVYALASTQATIAGNYSLAVSGISSVNLEGKRNFTIKPGNLATVDFTISTSAMTLRGGSITVTARLLDYFGNLTDDLGGYDSLAVIVGNREFTASTATVALKRQQFGIYKGVIPILVPGQYFSGLGGWKKDGAELNSGILLDVLDRFLRTTYDVSLSPGLAVRADFANVPSRLFVGDDFSPPSNQAVVTLRDMRGTRTHLWAGTVQANINSASQAMLSVTGNSVITLTTSANVAEQLADYGKLYLQPLELTTLGTYQISLNSTNGTAISTYNGNRSFVVQMPPARLTLPSLTAATLDFGSQFLLAPLTRSYTLRYQQVTTNTLEVAPTNHPSFLLSDSQNGIFTTNQSITLTVGGTSSQPVDGTVTLWARFLPTRNGAVSANVIHSSTLADAITTVASVRVTLRGTGLAPVLNVTQGTIPFSQIDLGQTRYYGYTMTYRNITAGTISVSVPAGNDFAVAQSSSGTWTTAGQPLTIPTLQPPTSATTEVQLWLRYSPTIAQSTTVTLTHLADGGDLRTVGNDNLVLTATKPPVILDVTPKILDLGIMQVGNTTLQTVVLTYQNILSPIVISPSQNIKIQIDGMPLTNNDIRFTPTVATGQVSIVINYTPAVTGAINRTINITNTTGSSSLREIITLKGVLAP